MNPPPLPPDSDVWEIAVPPDQQIPEHCPQPDRPCQWEKERRDFNERLTRMERQLSDIHSALAVGSERFKGQVKRDEQMDKLEADISRLTVELAKLAQTVGVLRTIVYGCVGLVLVTVVGAALTLVVRAS